LTLSNFLTLIVGLIIVFGIFAGISAFVIAIKRQYKIKVKKFERVNGKFQEVGIIKAKTVPVGNGGDSALLLKKPKKMLPMPTIQTGINTYWYFVSDDGEWINFGPGDFDTDRKTMGAHMLDREMRYARTSLQQMSKERYEGETFLQKYGGMIAYAALIIVTAVGFFLIVREMASTAQASGAAVDAATDVLKEAARILGALDNVKGGSGISPA
jgi:hypothetical protein